MSETGITEGQRSTMWIEARTKDVIYLRPVLGGGHGYTVKLQTRRPVGRDYQREVYCASPLFALERVQWLMELAPGSWSKI